MTPTTVTFVVLTLAGVWILAAVVWILHDAATRLGDAGSRRAARIATFVLVAWAVVATMIAAFVPFQLILFAPMALVPIAIGTWCTIRTPLSALLGAARIDLLIGVQVYRVAGAIFLYLYWTVGTLSWGFARNAGWGDVMTGVLALPVAWMAWRRMPYASVAIVAWCLFGIADLIVAPASAIYYGAERLFDFPINTVPLFLGPPLGILLQIFVLRAWWLQRRIFRSN